MLLILYSAYLSGFRLLFPALHEKIRQDAFDFSHERNAVNFLAFLSTFGFLHSALESNFRSM